MQKKSTSKEHKIIWVDFLRAIASFFVIMVHVEGMGGDLKWANIIYLILSRLGVPVFFMVSGFLLLSKQEPLNAFFKKRIAKVLIPFFAWSIFYDIVWNQQLINTGTSFEHILTLFIRIFRGPRAHHLWFLYPLIGLYIFTPVLRVFTTNSKQRDIAYFIGVWLITVPIFAIVKYYTPLSFGFELQFASGYIGYYLLGLYLGRLESNKETNISFTVLFFAGFLLTFLIYMLNIPPEESIHRNVYRSYLSLNFIIMSVGAFGLLKSTGNKLSQAAKKPLAILGETSFGIYLVHLIVLNWIRQWWETLNLSSTPMISLWAIPLITLLCFFTSFIIVRILKKIPLIKAIVP